MKCVTNANFPENVPSDVSIDTNMLYVRMKFGKIAGPTDYHWFYNQVKNRGPWDFKQKGFIYADFGNFHYGAVGYAGGIPEEMLLRGAGYAQNKAGTSNSDWGSYLGSSPYGDDPEDQSWIQKGIDYAKQRGY